MKQRRFAHGAITRSFLCASLSTGFFFLAATSAFAAALSKPQMAYVSIRTGDPQIWVRDGVGEELMLTEGKGLFAQPSMAQDGRLAFVAREAGRTVVFVMNPDGSAKRRVSAGSLAELAPSWSPDGHSLAYFTMDMASGSMQLHLLDLKTQELVVIKGNGKDKGPAAPVWSRDGQSVSFLGQDDKGRSQVWVVQSDGGNLRELSSKTAPRGAGWADLSPDGKKLVWIGDLREKGTHILVTDVASGVTTNLTSAVQAGHEAARWSPDGQRIVFASNRDDQLNSRSDIFVMNANGGEARNLSRHPSEDFDPKWSADGRKVVFASLRSGTTLLYEVDLASMTTQALARHPSHDMDHTLRPLAMLRD
ncbi:hypothetical protein [Roseateles sp.]|uniref:hypothetical protein n=1 Tax=Roseateles sp. TaxID=1971397 RepID=UPI00286B76D9|nr:hypothetical protein [Roseateles sp.]